MLILENLNILSNLEESQILDLLKTKNLDSFKDKTDNSTGLHLIFSSKDYSLELIKFLIENK